MVKSNEAQVVKDLPNRKVAVSRRFDADVETVWDFWTRPELLDRWWAPKPWKAKTKSLDFKTGGKWIYSMVGPDNERQGALFEYTKIDKQKSFEGKDAFADENGNKNPDLPQTSWKVDFQKVAGGTNVTATLTGADRAALEKLLEMGFEEGFIAALDNLEEELKNY